MTTERIPVERFHPGEYLIEEIEARGWTQVELAEILGRPLAAINEIITGKRGITPETAHGLAAAFGTTAEYWMNLETQYQLWDSKKHDATRHATVHRKARLYQIAPIKQMMKRGWIEHSDNVDVLEHAVLDFFGCSTVDDDIPSVPFAAKMAAAAAIGPSHKAWIHRAAQIANAVQVTRPFTDDSVRLVKRELRMLLATPQEIRHVPRLLAEQGVRLVIVEHLPQTKIDGAAFWLDARSPVIVMSLRYNRIDNFWFVLMHELDHVEHRDTVSAEEVSLSSALDGGERKPENEIRANEAAASYLIPSDKLTSFILRKQPLFHSRDIENFAASIQVHPGLVVGQLNYQTDDYSIGRKYLVRIREIITSSTLTDGWGQSVKI